MAYSSTLKTAIGELRTFLTAQHLAYRDTRFTEHGNHEVREDAPLLLVACSGGRDSLALAAVTHIVAQAWGMRCGAVIIDHQLQSGSAQVAQQAAHTCQALGCAPVIVESVDVYAGKDGVEAAARQARYAALVQVAQRTHAVAVLLAHTMDDQAEGVLIGLIRTGGTDAIAGMPSVQNIDGVRFVRPFLQITRAQTTTICHDLHLSWWDDPTNGDQYAADELLPADYPLRSRVRHTLLPLMSDFAGRDMTVRLAEGARIARRDIDFIDACADRAMEQCVCMTENDQGEWDAQIDALQLAELPEALRYRVIARVLSVCAPGSGTRHVQAVESLVSNWHGQQSVPLPRQHSANRKKHVIRVCKDVSHANRGCAR